MKTLAQYEYELLANMLRRGIIGKHYLPIETIAARCKWHDTARNCNGGKIKAVIHKLAYWGFVDLHGKGKVASLTPEGVAIARDYLGL